MSMRAYLNMEFAGKAGKPEECGKFFVKPKDGVDHKFGSFLKAPSGRRISVFTDNAGRFFFDVGSYLLDAEFPVDIPPDWVKGFSSIETFFIQTRRAAGIYVLGNSRAKLLKGRAGDEYEIHLEFVNLREGQTLLRRILKGDILPQEERWDGEQKNQT